MVVETRYAAGDGLLLGSGDRWLLMTDPGDEDVVERLWAALGDGADAAGKVLDVVEAAFGGEPPALVLVDLTPGTGRTVSLGGGRVEVEGTVRLVSLGEGGGPHRPLRRFLGGVVGAHRAEIRPAAARPVADRAATPVTPPAASRVTTEAAPPAPVGGLIDGIPQAILEARGPDGPPVSRRVRPSASDSGPRETREPDPTMMQRVEAPAAEVTASTPYDAPAAPTSGAGAPAGVPDDEPRGTTGAVTGPRAASPVLPPEQDGSTVFRSVTSEHLTSTTGDTVQAVWCPEGHLTPPDSPLCRVCRKQVAPQTAQRVARPTLGGLRLPTGEVVPLDRGVVLGRRPAPVPGAGDWPHLVHLPPEHTYVSRMHVQIQLDGWLVLARDLGSRGGTTWKVPGQPPVKMVPDESYVLEPGHALDLADVYEVRYDAGPEVSL